MPDGPGPRSGEPIAIVGLACRFPDAGNPAEFLDLVLSRRRAFRRLPPGRLGQAGVEPSVPAGDHSFRTEGAIPPGFLPPAPAAAEPGDPVAGAGLLAQVRAGLIEGWRFDRAAFGITQPAYQATDPAHWLALETAARALTDGGVPGGQGLRRDRTGVIIGNTLTGEVSRATGLRPRWPYVRRVIESALAGGQVPAGSSAAVLRLAEAGFLAPFPEISEHTLAGSLPSAIADRICGHFGFRGGGHVVDAAHSASLLAVASACSALAAGELDAAVAGGVDISLDPFELSGLAQMGVLATTGMRVYDARPTGFWPGEGCGLVVLMRAADARAAGLASYAQIMGWGTSSAGSPALSRPGSGSLLLALRRAYQRAGIAPEDVQLIEGDGTGTGSGDLAELTSLAEIRGSAPGLAAIGSVKANIGHAKAAAGIAGLIKTVLSIAAGVIPPGTGCVRPHPLIASEEARLRVPAAPEPWPARTRLAGVSSVGPGGSSVHVVLRRDVGSGPRRRVQLPGRYAAVTGGNRPRARRGAAARVAQPGPGTAAGRSGAAGRPVIPAPATPPGAEPFVFSGPDREAVTRELTKVAAVAPWLSDAELGDLACQLGSQDAAGPVRAGLAARSQDELARLAGGAAGLLGDLAPGKLAADAGIYAADGAGGGVTLLFPGEPETTSLASSLASLRWLAALGVTARAGTGHGLGELAGLAWAGCLSEPDAERVAAE
ncbi:MAG: polyketide synthase, partial [Actinobacteria bacterium]|nr:polyketide synthase [Actinomycetota bacterium]